jgi:Flp pilus assembly pilin Flp
MKPPHFLRNQSGVTGIEYTLIVGGIALATVLIMTSLGSTLLSFFTSLESSLNTGG